jgi:hypothetical protein
MLVDDEAPTGQPTATPVHGHANCHVSEGTYAGVVVNQERERAR